MLSSRRSNREREHCKLQAGQEDERMRVRQDRMKLAGETRRRKRLDGPRSRDASDDQPTVRLPPAQLYLSQHIHSLLTSMLVLRESKLEKNVQCLHLRIQCLSSTEDPTLTKVSSLLPQALPEGASFYRPGCYACPTTRIPLCLAVSIMAMHLRFPVHPSNCQRGATISQTTVQARSI